MNPLISIIHPTRRLQKAAAVKREWLKQAKNPIAIEYFIICDQETIPNLNSEECDIIRSDEDVRVATTTTSVEANNYGAKLSNGKILIMVQDDMDCEKSWDQHFLSLLPQGWGDMDLQIGIGDGLRDPTDDVLCHMCMTKARYNKLGYFVHPAFKHCWADNFAYWLAVKQNTLLDLRTKITWKHNRKWDGGKMDAVYARTESWMHDDAKTFVRLKEEYEANHNK